MNNPDYFDLAVNLTRAQGMLTLAQIEAQREHPRDRVREDSQRESEDDREIFLFDREEARAINSRGNNG